MEVQKLNPQEGSDFAALLGIFKTVFENKETIADVAYLEKLLSSPEFMVFVVKNKGVVIGGLTIYVLAAYYDTKPTAFIYDVGIAPEFQRQGIGKLLLTESCKFCKENGFHQAFVEAELEDLDAIEFYRKTPADFEMKTVQFTYDFGKE